LENIETLKQELFAPMRTFRLFAIESVLKSSNSDSALPLLIERLEIEDDPECIILLKHAIASIKSRIESKKSNESISVGTLFQQYSMRQPTQQLDVVNTLKVHDITSNDTEFTLDFLLSSSSHTVVTAQIIKKFHRIIPNTMIPFLKENLFGKSMSLRVACLEALIKLDPGALKGSFEKLVLSKDPVIRALAIRGLAKTSPVFASEFLRDFLDSILLL